MSRHLRAPVMILAGCMVALLMMSGAHAGDDQASKVRRPSQAGDKSSAKTQTNSDENVPEVSLLDAMRKGQVAVRAEGSGDGRMTVSLTNRSRKPLRVVLPPGVVAQGATGQFGGMGGMGGGMGGMG